MKKNDARIYNGIKDRWAVGIDNPEPNYALTNAAAARQDIIALIRMIDELENEVMQCHNRINDLLITK